VKPKNQAFPWTQSRQKRVRESFARKLGHRSRGKVFCHQNLIAGEVTKAPKPLRREQSRGQDPHSSSQNYRKKSRAVVILGVTRSAQIEAAQLIRRDVMWSCPKSRHKRVHQQDRARILSHDKGEHPTRQYVRAACHRRVRVTTLDVTVELMFNLYRCYRITKDFFWLWSSNRLFYRSVQFGKKINRDQYGSIVESCRIDDWYVKHVFHGVFSCGLILVASIT
jgi:hypothetical protein